jgi:serine/threonine protein kinase
MPADVSNVKELFLAVLELPATEREAHLDTACRGDDALRRQVEAMLQCHAYSGELLDRPPAEMLESDITNPSGASGPAPEADPAVTSVESAHGKAGELSFLLPSANPDLLGQLGPYEVQKVIGKGGFGIVLKAFDARLHRVVAIKVLSPAYAAVGSARKRFSREARAAAAVKNVHVVGIHDVQGDADPPYFVMEYVDGISLQDKIDRHGALGITEILRIGLQIAEGLAAAHAQGLVHRDIKPANILLENGVERVKITDFGLARAVDDASLTQSGTLAGTPMYMSPEQAEGLPIDHRSDLFSLGTVLYAMCTGHPPFRASGTHAVIHRVIEASPRPIREVNNEVPAWLADIIAKLHAKQPVDRFQTAAEVAELLGRRLADVQAGRAIHAEVPPVRRRRIRPIHLAAVCGALLAIGCAVVWLLSYARTMVPPQLALAFVHPTARVVLESDSLGQREYSSDRKKHTNAIIDLPAGTYRLSVFVAGRLVDSEEFALAAGHRLDKVIEPTGRLQITNESDEPVTVYGLGEPGAPLPQDEESLQKMTRHVVGPRSALVDTMLAGAYQWVRGDVGGECFVMPGQPALLQIPPKKAGPAWVKLFNGNNLAGWTNPKKDLESWKVENGVLIGKGDQAYLRTERGPFADFKLRMQAKYVGGTAGLVVREQSPDVAGAGYECSMENNREGDFNTGSVMFKPTKNLMGTFAVAKEVLTQEGQWFTLEVLVNGNRVQTVVNGKKAANFVDIHNDFKVGHIGLIVRGKDGELHVKNLEIMELPPDERGWMQLFNGRDLDGWDKARYDAKWEVVNCVLRGSVEPQRNGMLPVLAKTWTNFHLKAEARVTKDGNAGLIFRSNRDQAYLVEFGRGKAGGLVQLSPFRWLVNKGQAVPPDQWFALDLIADGKRVTTKIDGQVVAEYADAAVAAGQIEVEVDAALAGGLVTVEVRSIAIKELPAADADGVNGVGKKDALAKDAVVQFCKLFTARNVDLLMQEVDVPFCREGGANIEDHDDLKRYFQKALAVRDPAKDTIAVKQVTTLPKLEESVGNFTDAERKALQAALGPDHRVVRVEWNRAGAGKHRMLIFVRFHKGEAKVVGVI